MADKSAKDKDADGAKKPLNKQTAKVVQDGVELTWDVQREGDPDPEAAAKFYAQSVEALRKFRDIDPRTMPALRAADKAKKEFWKALGQQTKGVLIGIAIVMAFSAYRNCDASSYDAPGERYRRYVD